jgi:cytoskeletal protein RodZ
MQYKVQTNVHHCQEQLLALGHVLSQARQEQGKSLEEVSRVTLIREKLLFAIETADLAELPETVYVRGLIRRYAEALGLDGETLASQFFTRPTLTDRKPSWKDSPAAQLRPLHLYGAYVFLIMAAVSSLSYLLQRTTPDTAAQPIIDPAAVEQLMPKQQRQPEPPSAMATPEAPAPSDQEITVEVELTQQSWVRIVADGKTAFEGILQQGDARAWSAEQSLTIRAGNAGGVVVSYNQGQAEALGAPGSVAERTFRPAGAISMINAATALN